jgi:hypothetical protein
MAVDPVGQRDPAVPTSEPETVKGSTKHANATFHEAPAVTRILGVIYRHNQMFLRCKTAAFF